MVHSLVSDIPFPSLGSLHHYNRPVAFSADTAARVAAEHKLELEKEQAKSTRLQQELEQAKIEKAELEKTLADAVRIQGEVLEQTESRATLAEKKLNTLKSQCDIWLAELKKINDQMDSEFLQTLSLLA